MTGQDFDAPFAVVGAGTWGRAIAQMIANAGFSVLVYDHDPELRRTVREELCLAAQATRSGGDASLAAGQRVWLVDSLEGLAGAKLVIESIDEELSHKQSLLQDLDRCCGERTLLASSTAALSISALGARMQHPERLIGLHFFAPIDQIPVVEVIKGLRSAPWVVEKACRIARSWGKQPVRLRNAPGFVVNRVARPLYAEALRFLLEGGSDIPTIDALIRECAGFPLGPFEQMDQIGIDENYRISHSIYDAFYQDPRYRPCWLQREYVEAGMLGCKRSQGFYHYPRGAQAQMANTAAPAAAPRRIVIEGPLGHAEALVELAQQAGIEVVRGSGSGLIHVQGTLIAFSEGVSATELATRFTHPDLVLVDLARDFATCKRVALARADQSSPGSGVSAAGFFQALGKRVSWIEDLPGLLVTRILAKLVNEASEVVAQKICTASDLDRAMELALGFPQGPLAWGQAIGLESQVRILDNLEHSYGNGRYRVSAMLRRKVFARRPFYESSTNRAGAKGGASQPGKGAGNATDEGRTEIKRRIHNTGAL